MPDDAVQRTLTEAEGRLKTHGSYAWLLGGRQVWTVEEVRDELDASGVVRVSTDTVARWFAILPHTQNFGPRIGLRATRDDLILYFAGLMASGQDQVG